MSNLAASNADRVSLQLASSFLGQNSVLTEESHAPQQLVIHLDPQVEESENFMIVTSRSTKVHTPITQIDVVPEQLLSQMVSTRRMLYRDFSDFSVSEKVATWILATIAIIAAIAANIFHQSFYAILSLTSIAGILLHSVDETSIRQLFKSNNR